MFFVFFSFDKLRYIYSDMGRDMLLKYKPPGSQGPHQRRKRRGEGRDLQERRHQNKPR